MINKTQFAVTTDATTIDWLEGIGYKNPHNLPHGYKFPVFIVDTEAKSIFGTSTTCMAAACSKGNRPIVLNLQQLKEKIKF